MPSFGAGSKELRATVHKRLRTVLDLAIEVTDFKIIGGARGEAEQDRLFREERTTKRWPHSKHNTEPSIAVDIAPYPIDWNSKHAAKKFSFLAGVMFGIAHMKGIKLRWGGDWDGDGQMRDQKFHDLPHIELAIPPDED